MLETATILVQVFENRDRIRQIARRYLSKEARQVYDSEDLAATVCRRILESGAESLNEAQTWELIRTVATHAAVDQTRREWVRHRRQLVPTPDTERWAPPIRDVLDALPSSELQQIVAFRLRGISFRVIARTLGLSERTTFRRWDEALELLREKGLDHVE